MWHFYKVPVRRACHTYCVHNIFFAVYLHIIDVYIYCRIISVKCYIITSKFVSFDMLLIVMCLVFLLIYWKFGCIIMFIILYIKSLYIEAVVSLLRHNPVILVLKNMAVHITASPAITKYMLLLIKDIFDLIFCIDEYYPFIDYLNCKC